MNTFVQKHATNLAGVLSGFDRILFRGTIRMLASPRGMKAYLWHQHVRLTEFAAHVHEVSTRLKKAVTDAVQHAGRPVLHLQRPGERKHVLAREIAKRDGIIEGPVCLLTAVEPCWTFEVRPDRDSKRLQLHNALRKCLFLYRYQFHPVLGFIHARIQSWFPFTAQVWVNGREWLASEMDRAGLSYLRRDNCFVWLQSTERAQQLMDQQLRVRWPKLLDSVIDDLNPIRRTLLGRPGGLQFPYYWSVAQSEWATDLLFRSAGALAALYPKLVRHAITSFGSPDVMRFLGHKVPADGRVHPNFAGQVITDLDRRPEGVRIKHTVNANGIKLYDKQGSVLRVETTIQRANDFKVFRKPEGHPQGERGWRPLRYGIADLHRRCKISHAANQRYLAALGAAADTTPLGELTRRLVQPTHLAGRRVRALRPWAADDLALLSAVASAAFVVHGFRNRDLVAALHDGVGDDAPTRRRRCAHACRLLRILRAHGLIRRIPSTHRYMLTTHGRRAITALIAATHASVEELSKIAA